MRLSLALIPLAFLTLAFAGCTSPDGDGSTTTTSPSTTATTQSSSTTVTTPSPTTHDVRIQGSQFIPAALVIKVGDTVRWTNEDSIQHTATSDDGTTFDSGTLSEDDTFSFQFLQQGTWDYYCKIHPGMTGSITVQ